MSGIGDCGAILVIAYRLLLMYTIDMSVRIRAILIIILINFFIILFSVFAGIVYVRKNIDRSIKTDMMAVATIADHFISAELELLSLKASNAAAGLSGTAEQRWPEILIQQEALYPQFSGMAVFDENRGLVVSAGEQPAFAELAEEEFIRRAFAGNIVFSTTYQTANDSMFYLAAPVPQMERRVLVATIPGLYFSERMSTFIIWETGHVFMVDSEGAMISNPRPEWVRRRYNFITTPELGTEHPGLAEAVFRMKNGETGIAQYYVFGVPRICAIRPVTGSREGWALGAVAPLPESPFRDVGKGLQLVGLVSFFLSAFAAIIASKSIKKPFEEVAALKEIAEANSESKTKFLASMSHEMRTPLNAVIGLSGLTLDGNIDGEEKENIQKVYAAGITLLGIINDILDISKIESGKFELNPIEYDVPSLINDAVTLNIMRIDEKPITFRLFIDETLPARLYGDDLRIKQIFNNLLSNAFKYTKAGVVEWRILWDKSGDDIWLISSIKDSGIGIRQEDLEKLFMNYSQVDTSANRKIEGTGLGLALTKYMVELMGGNITVDSEYGKGSTFTFRIRQGFVTDSPIGRDIAEGLQNLKYIDQKQQRQARMVRQHLPYARILVVDDVVTNLAVVKGIMKPYGMHIDCVTSGREAIDLIRQGVRYNAIFMDHMMPEMNGIEAVKIIRNEINTEYARTVPIIALTANAIRGNEEIFLNSGFQAFLSKPIDINQMDSVVRQWVRDKEQEAQYYADPKNSAAAESRGQDSASTIDGVDVDGALRQFSGDRETLVTVLRYYAEQTPALLDSIRTVDAENLADYTTAVHGVKGSSRGIYAAKAGDMAEALEQAGKAGDISFIKNNNDAFIAEVERVIASIKKWLQ